MHTELGSWQRAWRRVEKEKGEEEEEEEKEEEENNSDKI